MNLFSLIKKLNKKVSASFIDTERYWQKSPSNMLLRDATNAALKKYAKGRKVLDAGAGRLAYRSMIKQYAKSYTSSDFQKTHEELDVVTDIENMSFERDSFDIVFCSQVLEHVPHPWIAFSEIYRILKADGIVIITVPMLGYIHNAPYDFYRYTNYGLENLAKDAGFKIIELRTLGGIFSFFGYIRSTLLMPLYCIPLIGLMVFYFNKLLSVLDITLDSLISNEKVFTLNYLLVARKE